MTDFETKLKDNQWLAGQQPGAADKEALESMTSCPDVKTHPYTFAWWCLASKFTPAVRASWTAGAGAPAGTKPPMAPHRRRLRCTGAAAQ